MGEDSNLRSLKHLIVIGEMYDTSILPIFPIKHIFEMVMSITTVRPIWPLWNPPIFSISNTSKTMFLKIRCKYTNNFLIFQIFFNIFFSHEKRNRTFITTIITTARRFTIKLPHGVILLTFMTSMQRRGLEPLHPVFTTGALTYWAYRCSITSGGYQPQNICGALYSDAKCSRPAPRLGQLLGS